MLVRYGLRNKKTQAVLCVHRSSNEGADFCCETQHILHESNRPIEDILMNCNAYDELWLVKDYETAKAARHSTEWYNAGYDTPSHAYSYKENELEVVKVYIEAKIEKA